MIGRKSTKKLADLALSRFSRSNGQGGTWVPWDPVYNFLFENDFDAAFCNAAESAARGAERGFVEFILKLHTGESVAHLKARPTDVALEAQGQLYLRQLAEVLLKHTAEFVRNPETRELVEALGIPNHALILQRSLELDGYVFRDDKLLHVESAVINVEKQHAALLQITRDLQLGKQDVLEKCLGLSETHYSAGRWEDCIGNSRKFLEASLQESAAVFSSRRLGTSLAKEIYDRPVKVREFMSSHGLLSEREAKTIAETYGLLSETGNHPNMAANDQARLLRQIALLESGQLF